MRFIFIVLISLSLVVSGCSKKQDTQETVENNGEAMKAPVFPDIESMDFTTTASGLKYAETLKGMGKKPEQGQIITAHYSGWLMDGKLFDSSVQRGEPFQVPIGEGQVIKGWDEAIMDMNVGSKRVLILPPELAYGERAMGDIIPANSTLVFEVELISVTDKPETPVMPDLSKYDFKKTDSGLEYYDVKVGDGEQPANGQRVTVHYSGWLTNGSLFDSSKMRGTPFTFKLGNRNVIAGWEEGVATMRTGGTRILRIPPELGYGDRQMGNIIPANSTLIFEIEFLSFK